MKPEDIRGNTLEELSVLEGDLRRQLWKARFDNHTNQLDDTSSIQKLRRDLALPTSVAGATKVGTRQGQWAEEFRVGLAAVDLSVGVCCEDIAQLTTPVQLHG